jgi:hypothetical protein
MHRKPAAVPDSGKARRKYRVGQFVITRERSRWRIRGCQSAPNEDFSTLRSAITWCRQYSPVPVREIDFPLRLDNPTVLIAVKIRSPRRTRRAVDRGDA